jgi:glycosyltransferase involved in cell wall biosynthesis
MTGPEISVVIPTFNRRERLALVLDGLARQTLPGQRFEALVVDDGSTDGTAEWLAHRSYPFALRPLRQSNAGPAVARNAGVQAASARVVLFLDDDVVPEPPLLQEHAATHASGEEVAVIGPLGSLARYRQPWVAWEQAKIERQYAAMQRGDWAPTYRQFWTGNASVPRQLVLEAGGFDAKFLRAEDIELGARLAQRGVRFVFKPAAATLHHAERSLQSWSNMHRAYGRLELSIHGRFGRDAALNTLRNNWHRLRAATRTLVSACLGRERATAAACAILSSSIRAAAAVGSDAPGRAACSALANVLYWDGVRESLGNAELKALFVRPAGPDGGDVSRTAVRGP